MKEDVTPDLVEDLIGSRAHDAALVRYSDGHLEVRSTISTGVGHLDDYEIVVTQDDLPDQANTVDLANPSVDDLKAIAETLND